jgi:Mn2+/Fe2+ NRAMP family transporter
MRYRPGPGILLAATSIGGSHLVLSTTAGAAFGYDLLWLVVVAHLFKYPAFDFGPRLAVAEGISLLAAYRRAPGPRHWVLWVGLVDLVLESVGVLAAVAGLSGAILQGALGGPGLPAWTAVVVLVAFLLLLTGKYPLLRDLNLALMGILAAGTAVAFFAAPPPAAGWARLVVPSLPAGSLVLVASILGFLPTAVGVSLWQSLWTLEDPHCAGAGPDRARRLRAVLLDVRVGYLLSAVLAVCFVGLGAAALHPRGLVPGELEVAATLATAYATLFGEWMRPLFHLVAFATAFSTTYAVLDGMPRTLVATVRHLRDEADPDRADRGRLYWSYLVGMTVLSLAVVRAVPEPVVLLTVLGAATFLVSPLYYLLNAWAARRFITDPALRPGRGLLILTGVGLVFLVGVAGLLLYAEMGRTVLQAGT